MTSVPRTVSGLTHLRWRFIRFAIASSKHFCRRRSIPIRPHWEAIRASDDPDYPVVAVSWVEAEKYCHWLLGDDLARIPASHRSRMGMRRTGRESMDASIRGATRSRKAAPITSAAGSGEVIGPLPVGQGEPNSFGIFRFVRKCA